MKRRWLAVLIAVALSAALLPGCLVTPGDTSQISLVSSSTVGNWKFDYYRNNAYRCAISGYQTFVIGTRVGTNSANPAPLWVFLHGDGVGWFNTSGTPQPNNLWMTEEPESVLESTLTNTGLLSRVRIAPAGFRVLAASYCDRDRYMGSGQTDTNNPNLDAGATHQTNGLQATKAAIQYTLAHHNTSKYFLGGIGTGAAGAPYVAYALQLQGIPPAGVIADGGVHNVAHGIDAYNQGACLAPEYAPAAVNKTLARSDPAMTEGDIDDLVARHELTVPIVHVWNHGDTGTGTCGNTPMQCRLRNNTLVTMGVTDCAHRPLADAIAGLGATTDSMNLPVCVDDDATPDCSVHSVTAKPGLHNTDTTSPASYLTAIMSWVDRRLAVPGKLYAWGSNYYGQLGNGSRAFQLTPARSGTDTWKMVSGGFVTTLAIRTDGTLWGWGHNSSGELGDGTTTQRTTPVQIGTDNDWASVSVGSGHTAALKTNGTLWTWGNNSAGQLGDGTTTSRFTPSQIGTATNWASVSSGSGRVTAIRTNGTLWAWGSNYQGSLGDGTTTDRHSPVQIGTDNNWAKVSTGGLQAQAIKTNGTLWSWGLGGKVGDGTSVPRTSPVQIGTDTDWGSVSSGETHVAAIKTTGTLWAWGSNFDGQLGDGTNTSRLAPVQIGTDTHWASAAADAHTAALRTDGSLWTWGLNDYGQLGDGTRTSHNSPSRVGTANDWSAVDTGEAAFTSALKSDGSLWAWGDDTYGELGDSPVLSLAAPTRIGADTDWIAADGGRSHTLALKVDGSLWAWGDNNSGELGDGTNTDRLTPTHIGTDTDWASVSAGSGGSLALKTDGSLWGWGSDGTGSSHSTPTRIGTSTDWSTVSAGVSHFLAVKTNGTLWAWGSNSCGQLGDNTTTDRTSPVQIGAATNWQSVAAGAQVSLGMRTAGTIWRWGAACSDEYGGFGSSPALTSPATNWRSVSQAASSQQYTLIATKTDGTLWRGEWENGFTGISYSQVGTETDWALADLGGEPFWIPSAGPHMTKTNGSLWENSGDPHQIGTATKWVFIASGSMHSLAIARP